MNYARLRLSLALLCLCFSITTKADDAAVKQRIDQVVAAVGGEEKLLKLFRFREKVLISSTPTPVPSADDKESHINR